MKIIHICNCPRGGGIQNFLLSLLPEQAKQKHQVTLIVIEKYDYEEYMQIFSVVFQDFKLFAFPLDENIAQQTFDA